MSHVYEVLILKIELNEQSQNKVWSICALVLLKSCSSVTYTPLTQAKLNRSNCDFTQTAELADDGGQRVVGYTFQLVANPIRHCAVAQVPWLNVPLDQRHDPFSHLGRGTCWGRDDSSLDTATCRVRTLIHKTTLKAIKKGVYMHGIH